MSKVSARNILNILKKNNLSISVAESLTSGMLQSYFGSISDASEAYNGGITVYNEKVKSALLDVDYDHAKKVNSVSKRVAIELAKGACDKFETDVSISTTGYAEPSVKWNVKEPYAYYTIIVFGQEVTKKIEMTGLDRNKARKKVADFVLLETLEILKDHKEIKPE
jgi:nicotinamide-nucleotide amidase